MSDAIFPACHVQLPPYTEGYRAAFYLAAEEFISQNLPKENYLFTWQIGPTVVMGRNQDAYSEIDRDFCINEKIDIIRRKSGGGCIYADYGNIMISLITGGGSVESLFSEYALYISKLLNLLGADVEVTGRNDIIIKEKGKVCGNAFYHLPDRNIIHGTMLYDTNIQLMNKALTPEKAKLHSKKVKSVGSRVGFLKEVLHEGIGTKEIREYIIKGLTNRTICLTDEQVKQIKEIEKNYYKNDYLWGEKSIPTQLVTCTNRIEKCGNITLKFNISEKRIISADLSGDYFETGDSRQAFENAFKNQSFDKIVLKKIASKQNLHTNIRGLSLNDLQNILNQIP